MITLPNPFDWYPADSLQWPASDKKLKLVNDWVADVDAILGHVQRSSVAVQAGGACGIWPSRLALEFGHVYTVEPCAENYDCLVENCRPFQNITHARAAFGKWFSRASLARDNFEDGNAGAWYLSRGSDFEVITIDSLELPACDLIMLDVEGHELDALIGAQYTLTTFRPVVVVEAKQLPHMRIPATAAGDYLLQLGYRRAGKYHHDEVFTC